MRRRAYLTGVTAVAAAAAGCGTSGETETTDDAPNDDSSDDDPADETTTDGSTDDDSRTTAPSVAVSFDYMVGDGSGGELTITHTSGDTVRAGSLVLRGQFGAASGGTWLDYGGGASGDVGGDPAVVAGDSVTVSAGSDYELNVVWEGEGTSAVLAADEGPEA